jgi:hypothetical protein
MWVGCLYPFVPLMKGGEKYCEIAEERIYRSGCSFSFLSQFFIIPVLGFTKKRRFEKLRTDMD